MKDYPSKRKKIPTQSNAFKKKYADDRIFRKIAKMRAMAKYRFILNSSPVEQKKIYKYALQIFITWVCKLPNKELQKSVAEDYILLEWNYVTNNPI
jgi:hypothetical protein